MIEEGLDEELTLRSRRLRKSKAGLIRQYVREGLVPLPPLESDPLWQMCGVDSGEVGSVDDVVYPRAGQGRELRRIADSS